MDPLIRNRRETAEAVEVHSPAEQPFNRRRLAPARTIPAHR
jgi:hypothetical protein